MKCASGVREANDRLWDGGLSPGLTLLYIWLFNLTLMTLRVLFLVRRGASPRLFLQPFRRVLVVFKVEVFYRYPPHGGIGRWRGSQSSGKLIPQVWNWLSRQGRAYRLGSTLGNPYESYPISIWETSILETGTRFWKILPLLVSIYKKIILVVADGLTKENCIGAYLVAKQVIYLRSPVYRTLFKAGLGLFTTSVCRCETAS